MFGWGHDVGMTGAKIDMRSLGSFPPLKELMDDADFTLGEVVRAAKRQFAQGREILP